MGNPRSRRRLGGLPAARVATIPLSGGVDTETPTAQARPGTLASAINYEVGIRGGYQDIQGYRRIDGLKGTGPIIGLFALKGILYAINSSASMPGRALVQWLDETDPENPEWVELKRFWRVDFDVGGGIPNLVKGMMLRTVEGDFEFEVLYFNVTSGSFDSQDAAGYLITDKDPTGEFTDREGIYHQDQFRIQEVAVFDGASEITLQDGATYEFAHGGFSATDQVFMVNGLGQCVEFDGDVMVPIITGHDNDTPGHVAVHESRLWLSFGSSVMFSIAGDQYDFSGSLGGGELNTGSVITALHVEPGQEGKGSLAAFSDDVIHIIQGAIDSLNTQATGQAGQLSVANYRREIGAHPFSVQEMASTIFTDDWGVRELRTAQEFGNFSHSTLTESMQTLWRSMLRGRRVTASTISRRKNQYRVFLDDGSGIYVSFHGRRLTGAMPIRYPHVVNCATSDEFPDGRERIFIGTLNRETNRPDDSVDYGSVMECDIDEATSFDGEPICAYFVTNFNSLGSRGTWKGFKDIRLETEVSGVSEFLFGFSAGYGDASGDVVIEGNVPIMEDAALAIGASRAFNVENFMLAGDADGIVFGVGRNSAIDPPVQFNSADVRYTHRRVRTAQGFVLDPAKVAENIGERISCDMGDDRPSEMAINSVAPLGTASLLVKYEYKGDLVDDRVKAYYIQYRHEDESTWRRSRRIPVGTNEFRTPRLRAGRYEFQALAVNPSGPGPWSPSKFGSVAEAGMYAAQGAARLVPNKVTGLTNTNILNVSFQGNWLAPEVDEQHAAAESYNVRIRLQGVGDYGDPIPVDELMHVFGMLIRNTNYEWQAQGINEHGDGEWSDALGVMTANARPPGVPTGLTETGGMATAGTAFTEFVAGYTAPAVDADHGAAETYNIAYKRQTESRPRVITGITALSQRLHTLKPETIHEWRVQAVNSAGPGEWSDWREHTTAAQALLPPGVPTNLSNVGISHSSWIGDFDAPAVDAMHGAAERYGGEWRKVGDEDWNPEVEAPVDQITFTVPDDDTDYEWRVRAFNGAGAGDFSAPLPVKTLRTPRAPNSPTNAMATNINSGGARVGWTASVVDATHDAPTYYLVQIYDLLMGRINRFLQRHIVGSRTSVDISGLDAETNNRAWIWAGNAGGLSTPVFVDFSTLAVGTGVPNTPTDIIILSDGGSTVGPLIFDFGGYASGFADVTLLFAFKPGVVDATSGAATSYSATFYKGTVADNNPDATGTASFNLTGNLSGFSPSPLADIIRTPIRRVIEISSTQNPVEVGLSDDYVVGSITGSFHSFGSHQLVLTATNASGSSVASSPATVQRYGDNRPADASIAVEDGGIAAIFTATAGDADATHGETVDFNFEVRGRQSATADFSTYLTRYPFDHVFLDKSLTPYAMRNVKRHLAVPYIAMYSGISQTSGAEGFPRNMTDIEARVKGMNSANVADVTGRPDRLSENWSSVVRGSIGNTSSDPGYAAPSRLGVIDADLPDVYALGVVSARSSRRRTFLIEWVDSSNRVGWLQYVFRYRKRGDSAWLGNNLDTGEVALSSYDPFSGDSALYADLALFRGASHAIGGVPWGEAYHRDLFLGWRKASAGGMQNALISLPAHEVADYEMQVGSLGWSSRLVTSSSSQTQSGMLRVFYLGRYVRWSPVLTHRVTAA